VGVHIVCPPHPPPSPTRGEGDKRVISKVIPITETGKESAGHLKLKFGAYLGFGICDLGFKTTRTHATYSMRCLE
jgi:hypothetical protein